MSVTWARPTSRRTISVAAYRAVSRRSAARNWSRHGSVDGHSRSASSVSAIQKSTASASREWASSVSSRAAAAIRAMARLATTFPVS